MSYRRTLVAEFDVTGLADAEIDQLILEVSAQAEASDPIRYSPDDLQPGHPDVQVAIQVVDRGISFGSAAE